MAIPQFTEHGLLPSGVHECTFAEAEAFLCLNERRTDIWAGLENFLVWAAAFPTPDAFLIDGSYVTDKTQPADVDVVVDITGCSDAEQATWFDIWAQHYAYAKAQFLVDFYPFVIGEGNDFSAYFQYVRVEEALQRGIAATVRKGILKVPQ